MGIFLKGPFPGTQVQDHLVYEGHTSGCAHISKYCYVLAHVVLQKRACLHELGHAIGLWHEQDRATRDMYVTLHPENADKSEYTKD